MTNEIVTVLCELLVRMLYNKGLGMPVSRFIINELVIPADGKSYSKRPCDVVKLF